MLWKIRDMKLMNGGIKPSTNAIVLEIIERIKKYTIWFRIIKRALGVKMLKGADGNWVHYVWLKARDDETRPFDKGWDRAHTNSRNMQWLSPF